MFASFRDCAEIYIENKQWKYENTIKKLEEELKKIKESKEKNEMKGLTKAKF